MFSLEGHLATMSFEEEVSEFGEGDSSTVVDINSEHVLHDIVNLILRVFMEDLNNDLFDSFYVDLTVLVLIFLKLGLEFAPNILLESVSSTLHDMMFLKDMYTPRVKYQHI